MFKKYYNKSGEQYVSYKRDKTLVNLPQMGEQSVIQRDRTP